MKDVYLDLLKKGVQFPSSDAETETARQEVGGPFLTCVEKDSEGLGFFFIQRIDSSST